MGFVVSKLTDLTDVKLMPLKKIQDDRGSVKHMLRSDAPFFSSFGEIYFSCINPKAVKAWKRHKRIIQTIAVPYGSVRLVMYERFNQVDPDGKIGEIILGRENYYLVQIPPGIIYGFQCLSDTESVIASCLDFPYDSDEVETIPMDSDTIPYSWITK